MVEPRRFQTFAARLLPGWIVEGRVGEFSLVVAAHRPSTQFAGSVKSTMLMPDWQEPWTRT
jgi:hypothetical protein